MPRSTTPESVPSGTAHRERGIALFAAVWLALIISVLALGTTRETRAVANIAANEVEAAKARLAAESGVAWMALALAAEARGLSLPRDGASLRYGSVPQNGVPVTAVPLNATSSLRLDDRPYAWAVGETRVYISAQAEAGRYDLNTGDPALLVPLILRAGATNPQAVATDILVARARDGRTRGLSWRLAPQEFERVSDLAKLGSISSPLYQRLAPLVTTTSERTDPDPLTAPDEIFRSLPLDERERETIAAARVGTAPPWRPQDSEAVTITARAEGGEGAVASVSALVLIDPNGTRPVSLLSWDPR